MKNSKLFKGISSTALLATILIEANHSFIKRVPWHGFDAYANQVSFLLVPLWMAAIWGIWTERSLSKSFAFLGIFLVIAHSLVLSLGGNQLSYGISYLITGVVAALTAIIGHARYQSGASIHSLERHRLQKSAS